MVQTIFIIFSEILCLSLTKSLDIDVNCDLFVSYVYNGVFIAEKNNKVEFLSTNQSEDIYEVGWRNFEIKNGG